MKTIDITGNKYNMLTVIKFNHSNKKSRKSYWLCKCECGNEKVICGNSLKTGNVKSCGCLLKRGNTKHGLKHTRLYDILCGMKRRCYNPNQPCYKNYGARGIKVCDEWLNDPKAFYDWSITHGYKDDLTIDRINVNGNYEPSNCKWVSIKEQGRNKRNTKTS